MNVDDVKGCFLCTSVALSDEGAILLRCLTFCALACLLGIMLVKVGVFTCVRMVGSVICFGWCLALLKVMATFIGPSESVCVYDSRSSTGTGVEDECDANGISRGSWKHSWFPHCTWIRKQVTILPHNLFVVSMFVRILVVVSH